MRTIILPLRLEFPATYVSKCSDIYIEECELKIQNYLNADIPFFIFCP